VPRVACPGVPPLSRGLFWQKISEVVISDITLAQVVLCVKNSQVSADQSPKRPTFVMFYLLMKEIDRRNK
jgi:hypothetical protein